MDERKSGEAEPFGAEQGGGIMTEWTPGPWAVKKHGERGRVGCSVSANGGNISVCSVNTGFSTGFSDARLIAAAPDLYEALINCLSLVKLKFGNTDRTGNAAIEQATAALAKAKRS